jgi:hypothetical protein
MSTLPKLANVAAVNPLQGDSIPCAGDASQWAPLPGVASPAQSLPLFVDLTTRPAVVGFLFAAPRALARQS